MAILEGAELDKAVGLLILAQQHNISLVANGDKLRIARTTNEPNENIEIVQRSLGQNKESIMAVLSDASAVSRWLSTAQAKLATSYEALNDGIERWLLAEQIYNTLCPDNVICVCDRGHCLDLAVIRCTPCARKEIYGG